MEIYKTIKEIVKYSALIGALAATGCAANKNMIRYETPDSKKEITAPIKKDFEHPRKELAWMIYNNEPTYEDCERLDSLIKNKKPDLEKLVINIGGRLEKILGYETQNKDTAQKDEQLTTNQEQMISLTFYIKSMIKKEEGDTEGAINNLDTTINFYPYSPELYLERGFLKYLRKDINGAQSDYDMYRLQNLVGLGGKEENAKPKKPITTYSEGDIVEL